MQIYMYEFDYLMYPSYRITHFPSKQQKHTVYSHVTLIGLF